MFATKVVNKQAFFCAFVSHFDYKSVKYPVKCYITQSKQHFIDHVCSEHSVILHRSPAWPHAGIDAWSAIIFDIMIKNICPNNGGHYDFNKLCDVFHECKRIALH